MEDFAKGKINHNVDGTSTLHIANGDASFFMHRRCASFANGDASFAKCLTIQAFGTATAIDISSVS